MKTFKEFYYELLSETPHNISDDDEYFSELLKGSDMYDEIISSDEYIHVFTLNGYPPIQLLENIDGSDVMCYFMPTNGNDYIYGYVYYTKLDNGGVITTSVYNDKKHLGLAFKVYVDYLIPKYKFVMSDGNHTDKGKSFWKKLVIFALKKYNITIFDMKTGNNVKNITHHNELQEFYGDDIDFERYRIKIENI